MRILVWVSFPTSRGPIQLFSSNAVNFEMGNGMWDMSIQNPHFQPLTSNLSHLISKFLFLTFHFSFQFCTCFCMHKIIFFDSDTGLFQLKSLSNTIEQFNFSYFHLWLEVGNKGWEVGSKMWEMGNEKWEERSGKWEVGSGKLEVRKWEARKVLNRTLRSGKWGSNENSHLWNIPLCLSTLPLVSLSSDGLSIYNRRSRTIEMERRENCSGPQKESESHIHPASF